MFNTNIFIEKNTLGILLNEDEAALTETNIASVIDKPAKQRSWFTDNLYELQSFISGNGLGFVLAAHYDIKLEWDGTPQADSILVQGKATEEELFYMSPKINSELGSGIVTFTYPFCFKTQPGTKLLVINPPNMIIPGATIMTQVYDTDTKEENFSFNMKFNIPGIGIELLTGTPLVGVVPIPEPCIESFNIQVFGN
jgi:hypothetical protein